MKKNESNKTLAIINLKIFNKTNEDIFIEYATLGNPKILLGNILGAQDLSYKIDYVPPEEILEEVNCRSHLEAKKNSKILPTELLSKIKGMDLPKEESFSGTNMIWGEREVISELKWFFADKIMLKKKEVFETCKCLDLTWFPKGKYKIFIEYPNKITLGRYEEINTLNSKLKLNLDNYSSNYKKWKGKFISNIIEFTKE